MKLAALLAAFVGIILVGCSSGESAAVERPSNGDAAVTAPHMAQTKSASEAMCRKHWMEGTRYADDGQFEAAIQEFDKAIELGSHCAPSYGHRGMAYGNLGQYRRAIKDYDKAIEFFPESGGLYFWRASAYDELGQYQNAINDYTKVIQFEPDEASLYLLRGIALQKLYKFSLANKDFNKACKLDKSNC